MRSDCQGIALVLLAALPWTALAQTAATPAQNLPANYPAKPVRVVVPFTAGGPNDAVLRPLTQKFHELLGQPFVFDYRPGGGAVIGAALAAKSAPDGYTLLLGNATTHAINATLHKKLPYNHARDFTPISTFAMTPNLLTVTPSLGIELPDLDYWEPTFAVELESAGDTLHVCAPSVGIYPCGGCQGATNPLGTLTVPITVDLPDTVSTML